MRMKKVSQKIRVIVLHVTTYETEMQSTSSG